MRNLTLLIAVFLITTSHILAQITDRQRPAEWAKLADGGRFMDRFLPMTPGTLSSDLWGGDGVIHRFVDNGIEDTTYSYWGGNIVLGDDGKYHMFVCGWLEDSPKGHHMWPNSTVFHTISDNLSGPYTRLGVIGQGHNPEIYRMRDGRYILYVIDGYYIADSLDSEWRYAQFEFDNRDRPIIEGLTNLTFAQREDGSYLMICRGGGVWFSRDGQSAYRQVSDRRVYPAVEGEFEDPVVWRDHIQYHLIVNDWLGRVAFYLRSKDGVNWVTDPGEAYTTGFSVHSDGKVEDWFKYERIKVFQDKYGRAIQANFAVIDILKNDDKGNDNHSSKNICIPLNPGMLLAIRGNRTITEQSKRIEVCISAEEGFDPQTDVVIESLRFGASSQVNFGNGATPIASRKSGKDLIVVFDGQHSGLTADEFAPKMIGRDINGKMIYGYARMPGVEFMEPILSARKPIFNGRETLVIVENFGQVASQRASVTLSIVENGGALREIITSQVPALAPYAQADIALPIDHKLVSGQEYEFLITIKSSAVQPSTYRFKSKI